MSSVNSSTDDGAVAQTSGSSHRTPSKIIVEGTPGTPVIAVIEPSPNEESLQSDKFSPRNMSVREEAATANDVYRPKFCEKIKELPIVVAMSEVKHRVQANKVVQNVSFWLEPFGMTMVMIACPALQMGLVAFSALRMASTLCQPALNLCDCPVRTADWLLCKGLDAAEVVFPCLTVPPNQMCATTLSTVRNCVCCFPRTVSRATSRLCSASNTQTSSPAA